MNAKATGTDERTTRWFLAERNSGYRAVEMVFRKQRTDQMLKSVIRVIALSAIVWRGAGTNEFDAECVEIIQ
jgi:hypothetical protein